MIPTLVPKRLAMKVAVAGLLLVSAAPAVGATSAQQVYEAPGTNQTPSPLPDLSVPPAGDLQPVSPFTPRAVPGPGSASPGPLVAGSGEPVPTSSPCVPADGAGTGARAGTPAGAAECAPAPGDGTVVRNAGAPGPVGSTPVGEVASDSGAAPAAAGDGTLPVTGLDLLIVLAAAAAAAGVGISLRKAAAR